MWDAYSYIANLIRSAKEQVILIDNRRQTERNLKLAS